MEDSDKRLFDVSEVQKTIKVVGKTTQIDFELLEFTYGALAQDSNNPLTCVSVSNSSLSIDIWKGCTWQCRYCHVQGTFQDLDDKGMMPLKPVKRSNFSISQIIDELIKHPFFIKDTSIISIGTASTEPFAKGEVCESTFQIMEELTNRGYKNPFWIVTKAGFPSGYKERMSEITSVSKGVMISICWASNPRHIEPVNNQRFKNVMEAKQAGSWVSWYFRPIVLDWHSNDLSSLINAIDLVSSKYSEYIDIVVPGGLRWTEGIEYGLTEVHNLPMPEIPRTDNQKFFPEEVLNLILSLLKEKFQNKPVYLKSSCALSYMLESPSITSVQVFSKTECSKSSCPSNQRGICSNGGVFRLTTEKAQEELSKLGIPLKAVSWDLSTGLITEPSLNSVNYGIRQSVYKQLANFPSDHNE
jgi:DNA repair photolyase